MGRNTHLAEHEIAERARRRIERHLAEAKLLAGKTLENFDFNAVPMLSKAQISALCAGDAWLRNGSNLILVGPPGTGKSHLSSAIGLSLIEQGWKVLFARTSELVQRLQVARREPERLLNRGQRDADVRRVEDDDELGRAEDGEGPARVARHEVRRGPWARGWSGR